MIFDPDDPDAVAAWIAPRFEGAFRAAWRILGDPAAAEDAAQEALLAAVRNAAALARADDPERYLGRMAVNAALVELRSARSRRARERRVAMAAPGSSKDPTFDRMDEREAVAAALAGLPEDLRTTLILRYAEDLTFAEIGAAVECSAPAAHDRLRRAEARVRERLERAGFGALTALGPVLLAIAPPVPAGAAERASAAVRGALDPARAPASTPAGRSTSPAPAGRPAAWIASIGVAAVTALALLQVLRVAPPPSTPAPALAFAAPRPARPDAPPSPAAPDAPVDPSGRPEAPPPSTPTPPGAPVAPPAALAPETGPPSPPAAVTPTTTAWVEGYVVDPDGRPIEGVKVAAVRGIWPTKGELDAPVGFTGERGRFRLPLDVRDSAGERFAVLVANQRRADIVAYPGRGAGPRPSDPDPRAPPPARVVAGGLLEITAPRPPAHGRYTIRGRVHDASGDPVDRAEVRVERPGMLGFNVDFPGRAYFPTAPDGSFEVTGATLGELLLSVRGVEGHLRHEERHVVADGDLVEVSIRLARGLTIAGRVVSLEGAPIADGRATLSFAGRSLAEAPPSATLDAGGRFAFTGLAPGRYDIEGPGFLKLGVEAGGEPLEIRAKVDAADDRDDGDHGAELHGTIVDARTGEPLPIVPGSLVAIRLAPGADALADEVPELYFPPPRQVAIGGNPPPAPPPDAYFHLSGLRPGRHVIWGGGMVHYEGFVGQGPPAHAGPFDLAEGEIRRGVRLEVPRLLAIEGEASDARTGAPLAGVLVSVHGTGPRSEASIAHLRSLFAAEPDRGDPAARHWSEARSGPDGRFHIECVPPGVPLRLLVGAAGHRPAVTEAVVLREDQEGAMVKVALEPR